MTGLGNLINILTHNNAAEAGLLSPFFFSSELDDELSSLAVFVFFSSLDSLSDPVSSLFLAARNENGWEALQKRTHSL